MVSAVSIDDGAVGEDHFVVDDIVADEAVAGAEEGDASCSWMVELAGLAFLNLLQGRTDLRWKARFQKVKSRESSLSARIKETRDTRNMEYEV